VFAIAPCSPAPVQWVRSTGCNWGAGVGVSVTLDADLRVEAARAAFIGVGDRPVLVDVGPAVAGQSHDALTIDDAVAQARAQLDPSDDIHATASYRRHLAGILLGRAMVQAATVAADPKVTT
jgi:carbon-monoxide dehydrogenase medium subunit